jgi:hypothetical protein
MLTNFSAELLMESGFLEADGIDEAIATSA